MKRPVGCGREGEWEWKKAVATKEVPRIAKKKKEKQSKSNPTKNVTGGFHGPEYANEWRPLGPLRRRKLLPTQSASGRFNDNQWMAAV